MSMGARVVLSAMRCIKKMGFFKGPNADLEVEIRRAREYNRKHAYKEPADRKAIYRTIHVRKYPCLTISPKANRPCGKAILFLHGGGDRDTWKPEVAFARTYGKQAGADVFYPLYPPFTEASPVETADLILEVYRTIVKQYGADNIAVIGNSYGGFLAMQLLTWTMRKRPARLLQVRSKPPTRVMVPAEKCTCTLNPV